MIVLTMGVSGAGKSTLASALAARLGWFFLEADQLHSPANVAKMRAGQPLTDADRGPWLLAVAERLQQLRGEGRDAVLACSALKLAYRAELKRAAGDDWLLIYLRGDPAELRRRLSERQGHYMPAALLESQLATLEVPGPEEQALVLDARGAPERNLELAVQAVETRRHDHG